METLRELGEPLLVLVSNVNAYGVERTLTCYERCCRLAAKQRILVLLRDPELSLRERLSVGRRLRTITRTHRQWLSVRDRLDLAMELEADGLHLTEQSVDGTRVRDAVKDRFWISRAVHRLQNPPPEDVDAVLLSPVCAPRKNQSPIGLEALHEYCQSHRKVRVIALGGIDASNAGFCLKAQAAGVAVMGAVFDNDDAAPLLNALGILVAPHASA